MSYSKAHNGSLVAPHRFQCKLTLGTLFTVTYGPITTLWLFKGSTIKGGFLRTNYSESLSISWDFLLVFKPQFRQESEFSTVTDNEPITIEHL